MKLIIIEIAILVVLLSLGGYVVYDKVFNKPIDLAIQTTQVAPTPHQLKKVKKVKQMVNLQTYEPGDLFKKYKLTLKPSERVGAVGEKKTDTGKVYITSVIDVDSGENKILTTDVRDKFRLEFDPSLGLEVKALGSVNADMARIYGKANLLKLNGNIDLFVKGEVAIRKDVKYQTNYGAYAGVEWHFLK